MGELQWWVDVEVDFQYMNSAPIMVTSDKLQALCNGLKCLSHIL